MPKFSANVQYDDWKGTAAADSADRRALGDYLRNAGLIKDGEFLVGFEAYIGEMAGEDDPYFSARAFVMEAGEYETGAQKAATEDPLPVHVRPLEIGLLDFFKLFKRFDIVLTLKGFDLTGREYTELT